MNTLLYVTKSDYVWEFLSLYQNIDLVNTICLIMTKDSINSRSKDSYY